MFWLNNLKITFKLGLIVALLAVVMVGSVGFAAHRMKVMDDANTDIVTRVDKYTTLSVRASRRGSEYLSAAFQLASETTDAGNVKYLAIVADSRQSYAAMMATVMQHMPEKAAEIRPVVAGFETAFEACSPAIAFASKTTSPDEASKAAARLKADCLPLVDKAIQAQAKLTDELLAEAARTSEGMTADANASIRMVLIIAGGGLFASLAAALWIGIAGLAQPIGTLMAVMDMFSKGEFSASVPGTGRRDEIGEMSRAVEVFKTNGLEVERMRTAQQAIEMQNAELRRTEMNKLASDFESAVGEIIDTVSSASTELEASAGTMSATAERAQQLTTTVAAASEQASANVQSVASATEEMASSVNEIGRQVQESAKIAGDAVEQARSTNDRVGELAKAAARIGAVVELINTIAGQTNLLALNATIEAARAGEAGRGFAVVASEVKALAEQTAKATGEIGQQIASIQTATQESVGAIKEIGNTIGRMSEIAAMIASAVEEQGAATQEISRNVQQAAQGTMQVSSNIVDVQRGASETGAASSQVLTAAQSLSRDSNRLKLEVGKFIDTVRAA
jgi:methyl-accepting chemotaxis protein